MYTQSKADVSVSDTGQRQGLERCPCLVLVSRVGHDNTHIQRVHAQMHTVPPPAVDPNVEMIPRATPSALLTHCPAYTSNPT